MINVRINTLIAGLRKYWYWLEEYKKRNPADYYNDGYDDITERVIHLLNILHWINGHNYLYDDCDFTNKADVSALVYYGDDDINEEYYT